MQKNVNEDLPVEAGYAFDMEDEKVFLLQNKI